METLLYVALIVLGFLAEIYPRIDTNTIIKKLAIGSVIIGAMVGLAGSANYLVELGVVLYFVDKLLEAHVYPKNRRAADKISHQGSAR